MRQYTALRTAAACALTLVAICPTPAEALDNPLTVNLRGAITNLTEAAATIFGSGSNVLVDVTRYRGVLNGSAVTLNIGTCRNPGRIIYELSPFTNAGSITELRSSISEVAEHAGSMIIHQTASVESATFACGNVIV